MKILVGIAGCLMASLCVALGVQPLVAVHDSEFTRTLLTRTATAPTPITGATGFEWFPTNWPYFVMPESLQEGFRSDGTPFATVQDADVIANSLIDADGTPKYPILFSLASEAIDDAEIAPLTNYVAAGGFLFVGSSSFTRNTNGTTRNNFAFATEMGMNTLWPAVTNWRAVTNIIKFSPNRLTSHIPDGRISWLMPFSAEDIPYGPAPDNINSPSNGINFKHLIWQVTPTTATVLASNDVSPDLLIQQYGKGYFIYYAPMQPLIGHGGEDSAGHAYVIFRKAIEWAFESSKISMGRLSAWPYKYDAAVEVRHDLESVPGLINQCEASAAYEKTLGLMGDYYPCTGEIRDTYSGAASAAEIASLRRAVTDSGAMIGSHNGGLPNPYTASTPADYWYWHWSPDEVLSVNVSGYPSGQVFAFLSVSNSFQDIRGWLSGITNNARNHWVAPAYNSTREGSKELLDALCITVGEEKLTFFPHWTLSAKTSGKRFSILSIPLSDGYAGASVSHSIEGGHTVDSVHRLIDFYYKQGGLINQYGHSSSAGTAPPVDATWARNDLMKEYCDYVTDTNRYPRLWSVNSEILYDWWRQRSNAVVRASFATNLLECQALLSVSNSVDAQTAVEIWVPRPGYTNLVVLTNGVATDANYYRTAGQTIRVLAGTLVTNVQANFTVTPDAQNDLYSFGAAGPVTITAPGILTNDAVGFGTNLVAQLETIPGHGTLSFGGDGGFVYTPTNGFVGLDSFTYRAVDGVSTSAVATVTLAAVSDSGLQYLENFTRGSYPAALSAPWTTSNTWTIAGAELRGTNGPTDYGLAYIGASWTNCSVQARVRFPAGPDAPGASVVSRFDPNTGARYSLWLYPGNTEFGTPNLLRLIKFTGWTTWSGTPMADVTVTTAGFPAVGTNWHTLKLTCNGNQISGSYEGVTLINVTDSNFSSVPAYLNGGIGLETYKLPSAFVLSLDDVVVNAVNGATPVPHGTNDTYQFLPGITSTVAAPGVLINDATGSGGGLTAQLISGPSQHNGAFTLNADGSFSYTPVNGYKGPDSFTYQVYDGANVSDPTTVNLTVLAATNTVFFDNFARTTDPAALTGPWGATNNWSVIRGQLAAQPLSPTDQNYAFAVINSNWANCSVEAPISFPDAQSGGGGIGGRLDVTTGARYSAWIYADGSPYGATHAMELFVWSDWDSFTSLGFVTLPGTLGTGPHTLKLTFETNMISVYLDGTLRIQTNDNTLAVGGVDVETFEDPTHYAMLADYLLVTVPVLAPVSADDNYSVNEDGTLSVPAGAGVLTNDVAGSGGTMSTVLQVDVLHGTLTLTNNGGFVYSPAADYFGSDSFTYQAVDSTSNSFTAIVNLTVNSVNDAPSLTLASNVVVLEDIGAVSLPAFASTGTGPVNESGQSITGVAVLNVDHPGLFTAGPAISGGTLTFTPAANSNGVATITVQAQDSGGTANSGVDLSAPVVFTITITNVNDAPTVSFPSGNVVVAEDSGAASLPGYVATTTGPANESGQSILGIAVLSVDHPEYFSAGPAVAANGTLTFTPAANSNGVATITVQAQDDGGTAFGGVDLSTSEAFTITITAVNDAPTLSAQTNHTITVLTPLTVNNAGSDVETPANLLLYSLDGPSGASIDANGVITWTPSLLQYPTTNLFTTIVTDDGVPALTATNLFSVIVTGPEIPLVIRSAGMSNELFTVTWDAVAGKTYRLQYLNDVAGLTWTDVAPDVTAGIATASQTNGTSGATKRFYRVLLIEP